MYIHFLILHINILILLSLLLFAILTFVFLTIGKPENWENAKLTNTSLKTWILVFMCPIFQERNPKNCEVYLHWVNFALHYGFILHFSFPTKIQNHYILFTIGLINTALLQQLLKSWFLMYAIVLCLDWCSISCGFATLRLFMMKGWAGRSLNCFQMHLKLFTHRTFILRIIP